MGFLRNKSDSPNERELSDLRTRKGLLEKQLATAEGKLAEAVEAQQKTLLEGDLDQRNESTKNVAGRLWDEVDATRTAIGTLDRKIAETEQRFRQDQDRAAREQEAKRRRTQVEEARKVAAEVAAAIERLVPAMQVLAPVSLSAGATAASAKCLGDQLSLGVATGCAEVESYILMMQSGNRPVVGEAKPVVTAAPPPQPAVERQLVYLLTDAVWPEADGTMRYGCTHGQASPPIDIARRAIALNLADPFDSSRSLRLREIHGCPFSVPHPSTCTNLLTGEKPKPEGDNGSSAAPAEYCGPARAGYAVLAPARW
jgi:hypothetical protein